MTRYTKHKHGLTMGWSNWFFWFGPDRCEGSFNAVIWTSGYEFTKHSYMNYRIRTPAQQFIWNTEDVLITEDVNGKPYEHYITSNTPTDIVQQWCNANAPGWKVPPPTSNEQQPTLFFTKKKHALAFVKFVNEQLAGMKFSEL